MSRARVARRLRGAGGYSLVELVAVMTILLTVLTALTAVFVSGAQSELDANRRFQAQQEARVAVDRLRKEVHCASGVAFDPVDSATVGGKTVYRKISVTLPAQCPEANGSQVTVVYETAATGTSRYELRRQGARVADYITASHVFSYEPPSTAQLGRLTVDLPVNVNPNEGWKTWRLTTNIVLRNTKRSS